MIKADDVQSDLNLEEFFKEEDFKSQSYNASNGDLAIRSSYYDDEVVCVLERILPDDSDDKMDVIVSCAYDSIDSVVDSVVDSSNEILAVYELEDRVVFGIENPSKAVFSDWTKAGMKSWSRLPYSTSFDSGWKGVKIKKGMGYQIEIKGSAGIIYSDIYYFQGNRAVIEDLRCPYESYVKNECDF